MIHDPCSIDRFIEVLNSMLEADPVATRALVETRVPCNATMAAHPTVQVLTDPNNPESYSVGLLGVVNGIGGIDDKDYGPISAHFDVVCTMKGCMVTPEEIGDLQEGELCPNCGKPLEVGDLTHFARTVHKEE